MRRIAWGLLVVFTFAIPWEYSLDLGPPWGNVARILGLALLLVLPLVVLEMGRARRPGAMQWLVLALFCWFCLSSFWSIDQAVTLHDLRGLFQELMIVWLLWELVETPGDLRVLIRAMVLGCWVLAVLTYVDFSSPDSIAAGDYRFAAYGQDPNDVARFLDLGFPLAALLARSSGGWFDRVCGYGFLPTGLIAVVLTASRGGFLAAAAALAGCLLLLGRGRSGTVVAALLALPALAGFLWFLVPYETLARLATIPDQLRNGDLNQRLDIWAAGWDAFAKAPWAGWGAGTFVQAAHLAQIDTAHNTALSIAVSGGLWAVLIAVCILLCAGYLAQSTKAGLRIAFLTTLTVWAISSLVGTVEQNRITWLLFGLIAVAGRFAAEDPAALAGAFPDFGLTILPPLAAEDVRS